MVAAFDPSSVYGVSPTAAIPNGRSGHFSAPKRTSRADYAAPRIDNDPRTIPVHR
jgi:hypothetical protein